MIHAYKAIEARAVPKQEKKMEFKKHKYIVECKCGESQENDDDGTATIVAKVVVGYCEKCCTSSVMPTQVCYDKEGQRIYD